LTSRRDVVIESSTVSARKLDSCWNSDCARSQRMLFTASFFCRDAAVSSCTAPFSIAAIWRASVSLASDERK